MKIILSSRRHHYVARVSIFLIAIAWIVWMVGCGGGGGGVEYHLTIASTAGGSVTTPGQGKGIFTYDGGEVVNLVAEAEEGYHFVNWTGDVSAVADVDDAITTIKMYGDYEITANFAIEYIPMVAAGNRHTVGLKSDGTVVAVGWNSEGQCDVSGWTKIIQVAAGYVHTVGRKSDGTVVAVGYNYYGQCNVSGWRKMSAAGRASPRSPQASITRWGLRPTAPWSLWDPTTRGSAMSAAGI
jgi:hypothetical protein